MFVPLWIVCWHISPWKLLTVMMDMFISRLQWDCVWLCLFMYPLHFFYGLGIPGKFISPQERWSRPVKYIQMIRWVASDKRCWSKTLKTQLSFCYWRNKLTRNCLFHCLFYPIWADINQLCLPFAKQLHVFSLLPGFKIKDGFECDQMWFVYRRQTKTREIDLKEDEVAGSISGSTAHDCFRFQIKGDNNQMSGFPLLLNLLLHLILSIHSSKLQRQHAGRGSREILHNLPSVALKILKKRLKPKP